LKRSNGSAWGIDAVDAPLIWSLSACAAALPLSAWLLRRSTGVGEPAIELRALHGPAGPAQVALLPGRALTIGRDHSCDLIIADPAVSRRHVAVTLNSANVRVNDAGSSAGVWIDGRRVYDEALAPGDQFQIGDSVFSIVQVGEPSPAPRAHLEREPEGERTLSAYELLDMTHAGNTFLTRRARARDANAREALVAVKFLSGDAPARGERAELRARFGRYVRNAMRIAHPACAPVVGGDAAAETPYVIEAFCSGGSLRSRAASLSAAERLRALSDVCAPLVWLHARGMAHGCLTPGDILFGADNRARLTNIGLASALGASADLQRRAVNDGFLAPECAALPGAGAQARADVYALGMIGRLFCPDATPPLAALLDAMRQADPAKRPDMRTVSAVLTQQLGEPVRAQTHTPGRPIRLQVLATGHVVPVISTPFALGRAVLNPADRTMSRAHAQLVFRDDCWFVETHDGCAILIDDAAVRTPRPLSLGDVLRLGDTRIRVLA
jgi:pSer/pThr/pTyr-binding forkhead associated (FHA) protein